MSKEIKRVKHLFYDEITYEEKQWDGTVKECTDKEPKFGRISMAIIGGLLLLLVLFGSIRTVKAGEVGIVTRFGEVNRVAESGLKFKIPFVESMTKMNIRVQKQEAKTDAATKDLQEVNGSIALNYSITNETALNLYKTVGTDYADTIITPILHESFKQGVSGYTAEQLMANRTEVKTTIQDMLTERLIPYGISVTEVNLTDLNFSAEFNAAIEQKAVMQQEAERARQELEKVKIEAEAKVEQAKAEAEAQRLQQETLTKEMIQKLWIERWNGILPEVVSDGSLMLNLE